MAAPSAVKRALHALRVVLGLAALLQSLQLAQALVWVGKDAFRLSAQLLPALFLKAVLVAINVALLCWAHRALQRRCPLPRPTPVDVIGESNRE